MVDSPSTSTLERAGILALLVHAAFLLLSCSRQPSIDPAQVNALMPACPEGIRLGMTEEEVKRLRPRTFKGTGGWGRLLEIDAECGLFNRIDYDFKPKITLLGPRRLVHFTLGRQKRDEAPESLARFVSSAIGKWGDDFDRLVGTKAALLDLPVLRWRKPGVTILAIYVPSLYPDGRPRSAEPRRGFRDCSYQIVFVAASESERSYLLPFKPSAEIPGAANLFTDLDAVLASPPLPPEEWLF